MNPLSALRDEIDNLREKLDSLGAEPLYKVTLAGGYVCVLSIAEHNAWVEKVHATPQGQKWREAERRMRALDMACQGGDVCGEPKLQAALTEVGAAEDALFAMAKDWYENEVLMARAGLPRRGVIPETDWKQLACKLTYRLTEGGTIWSPIKKLGVSDDVVFRLSEALREYQQQLDTESV